MTTTTQGTVCNPNADASHGEPKLEVSSFSHFGHSLGRSKKLNGSHDHNHAPFGGIVYLFGKI